jgi:uncharacterized protein (DUF4415 family)
MSVARQFGFGRAAEPKPAAPKPPVAAKAPEPIKAPARAPQPEKPKGKGGRPKKDTALEHVSLRLDPRVLAHYRASGDGWQSRLNADLLGLCGL